MSPIRAVVFDWGGVIQRTEDLTQRLELARELGLELRALEDAVFDSPAWQRASLGQCSAEETWREIALRLGWPEERLVELVVRFFAGDYVDPGLLDIIAALRSSGIRVGLLSNALPPLAQAGAAGQWGREGLFDAQVFSYQIGCLKPHPGAYTAALAALSASPEETLFVDDMPANVRAACEVGLHGLLFVSTEPLKTALRGYGLLGG